MLKTDNNWIETYILRVPAARVLLLFVFHAIVFTSCYSLAWLVRFEFELPQAYEEILRTSLPFVVSIQLLVGFIFGFYRGWWRYVGVGDVVRLALGLTTALALLLGLWVLGGTTPFSARIQGVSRAALLIDWAFALLTLFGARVMLRIGRDRSRHGGAASGERKRVLIIGAGDAGETLAREIEHRPQLGMKAVAFVDDHPGKWKSHIRGIEVRGPISEIATIAQETDATEALLAIPSAPGKRLREIVHVLADADLEFKTMPGIDQIMSGRVHLTDLRPVNADDLLRREKIELPGDPVLHLIRDRRVLVTGAGGTIGAELASQILDLSPSRLILAERSEYALYEIRRRLEQIARVPKDVLTSALIDAGDTPSVERLLRDTRPEIVLHAAAHKHVPLGEENPQEYLRNNALATLQFAQSCSRYGVDRFVFVSTDKAIHPTSVMGATKRAAEILLIDLARESAMNLTVVRFGNVIGSSGSVVPLFLEQIAAGGPVTVTHPDVTRYFLRTSEAVSLVLQAATLGDNGQVLMLDMGEPVRVVDLARDLIQLSNRSEEEIPIVFTGLRPGEKLFEEIRLAGESVHPTMHPRIVVTEAPQPDPDQIRTWLRRAEAVDSTPDEIPDLLRELVTEYRITLDQETDPPLDHQGTEQARDLSLPGLLEERIPG